LLYGSLFFFSFFPSVLSRTGYSIAFVLLAWSDRECWDNFRFLLPRVLWKIRLFVGCKNLSWVRGTFFLGVRITSSLLCSVS
jgi:hypothetical protein